MPEVPGDGVDLVRKQGAACSHECDIGIWCHQRGQPVSRQRITQRISDGRTTWITMAFGVVPVGSRVGSHSHSINQPYRRSNQSARPHDVDIWHSLANRTQTLAVGFLSITVLVTDSGDGGTIEEIEFEVGESPAACAFHDVAGHRDVWCRVRSMVRPSYIRREPVCHRRYE